ncbi:MAG: RtcB family protein [Rickettsiales bacterium]|jgi:tRNA-splicing ligase RtcB|nr:RtcB family protein [Rickettsiales bacterium]
MKKLFNDKVLSWCEDIGPESLCQIENCANHPWIKHIAIMPDCHMGIGVTIGSVLAFDNAVCPNAVGVDIGCGMSFIKTNKKVIELSIEDKKQILKRMGELIPVGMGNYKSTPQEFSDKLIDLFDKCRDVLIHQQLESAKYQLGSLGSGNHFGELQEDENGYLCAMIHSGSRNLGHKVCEKYEKIADGMCEKWKYKDLVNKKLSIIPIGEDEFTDYVDCMTACLQFSRESRQNMINNIMVAMKEVFDFEITEKVDIQHNYASFENQLGGDYWIHRKGATSARKDEIGIIPGSQGTSSYIVSGLGNEMSMTSCSHGAGRVMSRKEAVKNLDFDAEVKKLEDQGILHGIKRKRDLDEAVGSYKDIDKVIKAQSDLIKIIHTLKPLAVLKGS